MSDRLKFTLACLVAFLVTMALWKGLLTWAVPQFPDVLQAFLGWAFPGFCAGALYMRWRYLRLVRRTHGKAAAAALNERL